MKSIERRLLAGALFLLLLPAMPAAAGKIDVVFVISSRDSINIARAIRDVSARPDISARCSVRFITDREIRSNQVGGQEISRADIILADFMKREADDFLSRHLVGDASRVYSLRCGYLAEKLKKNGIDLDLRAEPYYAPPTVDNLKNLIFMVLSRHGMKLSYEKPFVLPDAGLFHPDADRIFSSFTAYLDWYRQSGRYAPEGFWVGIHTFRSSAVKEGGKLEAQIIRSLEAAGINALPLFGKPPYHRSLEAFFLDPEGRPRVHAVCGFSFRFLRGFAEKTRAILTRINAPVFIPLEAHGLTVSQWKASDTGISPLRTAWQVCIPEQNGGIEPTVVGGKTAVRLRGMTDVLYDRVPIAENIDFLIQRIRAWFNLKKKPNAKNRKSPSSTGIIRRENKISAAAT